MVSLEKLNDEQLEIFQALANGENAFITGEAGTGKSFLINTFSEWCYENKINLMKLAPTGVAAINIDGATIHSQFELDLGVLTRQDFLVPDAVKKADIILIDEIGMVRMDVFDCICGKMQTANTLRAGEKKKPLQLILVGDFSQLPPVIVPKEKIVLAQVYGTDVGKGFAFQSTFWQDLGIKTYVLHDIMRQKDEAFCKVLSKLRFGDLSGVPFIKENCSKKPIEDAIWLTGKNTTASQINENSLKKIDSEEYTSYIVKQGEISPSDYPCDDVLKFKVGAKVMMLLNSPLGFKNGDMGVIETYFPKEQKVKILMNDGEHYIVGKEDFKNYKYKVSKEEKETKIEKTEIGKATQFPFKLAYAITVHKSQGQTFEAINFIPELFDDGQFYVAISRCKSIDKIFIYGNVPTSMIKTAKEVIKFYNDPANYSFFASKFTEVKIETSKYEQLIKPLLENEDLYKSALLAVERKMMLNKYKSPR